MEIISYNSIAERAIRDLSGGEIPNDSPYNMEFAKQHARDAMQIQLKLEALRRRTGNEDDRNGLRHFIATYKDIPVQLDAQTSRVFAELPASFISLKYNRGIESVSPMKRVNEPYIRISNPSAFSRLAHSSLEGENYAYYLEGMRVYWVRDIKKDGHHKVLIRLITGAPASFTDDDMLPIIPESIGEIIDYVKAKIMNKFPQDRLVDNNPNIRQLNEQQK